MKNITLPLQVGFILFTIFLSGTVFAQVTSTSLSEKAGLMPGDTFYALDLAAEEIKKVFTTNSITKTEFAVKRSEERLAEAVTLSEGEGKVSEVERAVELYTKEFGVAAETILNADGALNIDEIIRLKAQIATDATHNLVILDGITKNFPDSTYTVGLAETQTIKRQLTMVGSIAVTDEAMAAKIFQTAVNSSVLTIKAKANTLTGVNEVARIDGSILKFNMYMNYGKQSEFTTTENSGTKGMVQESIDGVVNILSGIRTSTNVVTADVNLNNRRDGGTMLGTGNPNASGTATANTEVPRVTPNNTGAPAYQSNSLELTWMDYVNSRQ